MKKKIYQFLAAVLVLSNTFSASAISVGYGVENATEVNVSDSVSDTAQASLSEETFTVTFVGNGVTGIPAPIEVAANEVLDLSTINSGISVNTEGLRFNGWSAVGKDVRFGEQGFFDTSVTVTENMTLTAIVNHDYNFALLDEDGIAPFLENITAVKPTKSGDYLKVTSRKNDGQLFINDVNFKASSINGVQFVLDKAYKHNGKNKEFDETFEVENLYFAGAGENYSTDRVAPKKSVSVFDVADESYALFDFQMYTNPNWANTIDSLRFDIQHGIYIYNIRYIHFVPVVPFEETQFDIEDLEAPITGKIPDTQVSCKQNIVEKFEVTWASQNIEDNFVNGMFNEAEDYTVTIKVYPKLGTGKYFSKDMTATINGQEASVQIGEDGVAVVTYTFPTTDEYIKFVMAVAGKKQITRAGRYTNYSVSFKDLNGKVIKLPTSEVVWSISDESIAVMDQNGKLVPLRDTKKNPDGSDIPLIITATSVYNPLMSADLEVVIINQAKPVTIVYHTGLPESVAVSNMPENAPDTAGNYEFSKAVPTCDGYTFAGWALSDDTDKTVDSITASYATASRYVNVEGEDVGIVDVYGVWNKGVVYDFDGTTTDGLKGSRADISVQDGFLKINATSGDCGVTFLDFPEIPSSDYTELSLRVRYEYNNPSAENITFYYITNVDSVEDEKKIMRANLPDVTSNGGWEEYKFNLKDSSYWKDTIVSMRFDPFNASKGYMDVDYIHFLTNNRTVTLMDEEQEVESYTVTKNQSFTPASCDELGLEREGYVFAGWSKYPKGHEFHEVSIKNTHTIVNDTALYAVWNKLLESDGVLVDASVQAILVKLDSSFGKTFTFNFEDPNGAPQSIESTEITKDGYAYIDLSEIDYDIAGGAFEFEAPEQFISAQTCTLDYAKQMATEVYVPKKDPPVSFGDGGTDRKDLDSDSESGSLQIEVDSGFNYEDEGVEIAKGDVKGDLTSSGEVMFNFDKSYHRELFNASRYMSLVSHKNSVLTLKSGGIPDGKTDSPAFFINGIELDAQSHPYVIIKAKHKGFTATNLKMYYSSNGRYKDVNSLEKFLTDEYTMLVYDMKDRKGWEGTITNLYFSLHGNIIGTLDIDWIMFTDKVPESIKDIPGAVTNEKFPNVYEGKLPFTDVEPGKWYYKDIDSAYKLALVKGISETQYNPNGSVTLAEVITLAVRMNCLYNGEQEPEIVEGEEWYIPYVKAAIEKGIIASDKYSDYNVPALRRDVALILSKALPEEMYSPINMFFGIPDMERFTDYYNAALTLYNAGILTGMDAEYNFCPDVNVTRAEMATMVNRLAKPKFRKRIISADEKEARKRTFTAKEIAEKAKTSYLAEEKLEYKNGLAVGLPVPLTTGEYAGKYIPQIKLMPVFGTLNGDEIDYITIAIKCESTTGIRGSLYFTTPGTDESESKRFLPTISEPDENGIIKLVYDVHSNIQFTGEITGLRFTPYDRPEEFGIAYITVE